MHDFHHNIAMMLN